MIDDNSEKEKKERGKYARREGKNGQEMQEGKRDCEKGGEIREEV